MKKNDKVIIFDCQLLQTKAWHRGMGKYTAQMLAAFLHNKAYFGGYGKILFLFNSKLAYADDLKTYVEQQKNIETVFLSLDVPEEGNQSSITLAQARNKAILDEYIAVNFANKTVGFMISSLFLDEACPVFPTSTYNSVIYYDLIPLMYYRLYLGLGASEQYFTRFSVLLEADQIFAISETVANDLVAFLGVPKEKVINIRGASMNKATPSQPAINIEKPYILMPTGGDPRKNNLNGVKGFSKFNEQNDHRYQLVVTSFFTEEQRKELRQYSSDLVFTGNVSDGEIWWLYAHAETVLFPAEYEGLGMPILEAIDADKTIVCSDIAVFREISQEAFFMFDPRDPESISAALEEAFTATPKEIRTKKTHYPKISSYYTWDSTAQIVNDRIVKKHTSRAKSKPRIALVAPNITQPDGAGSFAGHLYPYLSDRYDTDFYFDQGGDALPVRPNHLLFAASVRPVEELTPERYKNYDLVVYIVSNSAASVSVLRAALALPGLVVLTDDSLKKTYEVAYTEKLMTRERFDAETGDYIDSLRRVALKVVTLVPGEQDTTLDIASLPLAYPPKRTRSLHNRMFVAIDASMQLQEQNVDFVKRIAVSIDRSKASITVVARTRFPEDVYRTLGLPTVTLYEDVSDHEYLTLLNEADLYIDARDGGNLDKLYPAFEAYRNGLDVFMGPIAKNKAGHYDSSMYVAKDVDSLCESVYQWLLQDERHVGKKVKLPIADTPAAIVDEISAVIRQKENQS